MKQFKNHQPLFINKKNLVIIVTSLGLLFFCLPPREYQNTALIPVPKLENDFYDWEVRHQQVKLLLKHSNTNLVFIGDSITHMFGGNPKASIARASKVWQQYFSHYHPINMGFGWDRTQNVLWRIENGELEGINPKVIVLLIGTNNLTATDNAKKNTPTEIAEAIGTICTLINKKLPDSHIILLSILPRSPEIFVQDIRATNKLLAFLERRNYITYLDLYSHFATPNGLPNPILMKDNAHPNTQGYKLWAETMEPLLNTLLSLNKS